MATQEDLIRLRMQTAGEQELRSLADSAERLKLKMGLLDDALVQGRINADKYAEHHAKLGRQMDQVAQQTGQATKRLEELSSAAPAAASKVANSGQAMLQGGRAIQDFFQGGIGGILNNIEGVTMALGGGAGLAGALTVVGVAASLAGPAISKFLASLTGKVPDILQNSLGDLKKQIEELEKKDVKVAVDVSQLIDARQQAERLEQALAFARSISGLKSPGQTAVGGELMKVFAEEGGGAPNLANALRDQILEEHMGRDAQVREARKQIADAQKDAERLTEPGGNVAEMKAVIIQQAQETITARKKAIREGTANEEFGLITQSATTDKDAGDALVARLRKIDPRAADRAETAIRRAQPEESGLGSVGEVEDFDEQAERTLRQQTKEKKERLAKEDDELHKQEFDAAKKINDDSKALREQGAENERAGKEKAAKDEADAVKEGAEMMERAGKEWEHAVKHNADLFGRAMTDVIAAGMMQGAKDADLAKAIERELKNRGLDKAMAEAVARELIRPLREQMNFGLLQMPQARALGMGGAGGALNQNAVVGQMMAGGMVGGAGDVGFDPDAALLAAKQQQARARAAQHAVLKERRKKLETDRRDKMIRGFQHGGEMQRAHDMGGFVASKDVERELNEQTQILRDIRDAKAQQAVLS
jgi:hypothetical protein